MCNLYRTTSDVATMQRLFRVSRAEPHLPVFDEIYPGREAPVIRADVAGNRSIELARWGLPPPGNVSMPVSTVRNLSSRFWRPTLARTLSRCLVPVTAFCERTTASGPALNRNRKIWFAMWDAEPFVFAGILRPSLDGGLDRFAFLTCAPNSIVGAVHAKAMPVILHGSAQDDWLTGDPAEALALPLADELMRVVE